MAANHAAVINVLLPGQRTKEPALSDIIARRHGSQPLAGPSTARAASSPHKYAYAF